MPTHPRSRVEERPNYVEAASDGLVALLSAGKESTDGAPIAKGVLGGLLWIVETCRQFKSNKQEWESFARYLLDLHGDLLKELDDSVDEPPIRAIDDFRKLQQSLAFVATDMNIMKKRSGFLKLVQVREDPKRISGFRQTINDAINRFNVLQLLSIRTVLETIRIGSVTAAKGGVIETKQHQTFHMKCCPPPTPLFTGRRSVLDAMHAAFTSELTSRHVFVLHGLGGAGKSQLAYKFVDESSREMQPARFSEVFYFDASSEASIISDMQCVAGAKGIGKSEQDTLYWLCGQHNEWLLIFNNADNTSFPLSKYFPSCSHGNILITSRNRDTRTYAYPRQSHCKISDMDPDDARSLLLVASGIEEPTKIDQESAISIVKDLGHLALGVIQAGAYISKHGCSLHNYFELYRKRQKELLEEYQDDIHRVDDYRSTVYTTWKISFEQLTDTAQQFLQLCACLHFDGIPDVIFRNAAESSSDIPTLTTSAGSSATGSLRHFLDNFKSEDCLWDDIKFNRVLSSIRTYSLIDFDSTNRTYSIHPLVHNWTLTTISEVSDMQLKAQHLITCSVSWERKSHNYTLRRSLLIHVDAILKRCKPTHDTVADKFALIYSEASRWKEAEVLTGIVVNARMKFLGKMHPDTLTSIYNLASTIWHQGRRKEAETFYAIALNARRQVLGDEHPATITSIAHLATTLSEQCRWQEAEGFQVTVTEARKRVLGNDHPDTLESIITLVFIYQEQDRWEEAETLHMTVMDATKKVLGDEHPVTLTSNSYLARAYGKQGRWEEAVALEVNVMETRKRVLGEEHPETLKSIANLACTYTKQGRWEEAAPLQVTVMVAMKRILGGEHPDTLWSMANLACSYSEQGQWKDAVLLQVTVMETRKRLLGEEHPHTLRSIANLARTYAREGLWKEAEPLQVTVMEGMKRVSGEENPETLTCIANLAKNYTEQGRTEEAEVLKSKLERVKSAD